VARGCDIEVGFDEVGGEADEQRESPVDGVRLCADLGGPVGDHLVERVLPARR
jgi:hypothetical protein